MKVTLKSGGNHTLARYDILAEDPHTVVDTQGFAEVSAWLVQHSLHYEGPLPFVGGLMGTIDYGWPKPRAWLMAPQKITIWDRVEERVWEVRVRYGAECQVAVEEITPPLRRKVPGGEELIWTPTISKQDYIARVQKILRHIHDGDIYQANFAQTFTAPFAGDAHAFWEILFRRNPAAFFAYIDTGTQQILSTSPELLLRQRGTHVESRPIKGTRPRRKTPADDAQLKEELLCSPKEGAELAMIVDLVRNDLHRACTTGSVAVAEHRMVEAYTNVFHQISVVTGKLPSAETSIAALEALFPGGSITGCPKIRAMEIIAETEERPRGIYTGSIGYASLHGTQDWNIAIRTAVIKEGIMSLSVGGGIVADSDPEKEYDETLQKAQTFFTFSSLPKP